MMTRLDERHVFLMRPVDGVVIETWVGSVLDYFGSETRLIESCFRISSKAAVIAPRLSVFVARKRQVTIRSCGFQPQKKARRLEAAATKTESLGAMMATLL